MEPAQLEAQVAGAFKILGAGLVLYLIAELLLLHFRGRKLRLREARMSGLGLASGALAGTAVTVLFGALTIGAAALAAAALSPIVAGLSWPWWIYGWVVYEFWYWVQHFAAHKVRLLWCIHSPHHAPGSIHMLVGANHHLLESVFYFPFFFGFMPALFGVHPIICVALNVVDTIWGSFLHISDELVPNGRYGPLGRFLQTPAHHRAHHGKNPLYVDTNYNSITLLWDWLLGTLQPLQDAEPVRYGITREVDTGSFWDVHFGEFRALWRDIRNVASWADRVRYLAKPPGWAPNGSGRMVADVKRELGLSRRGA